MKFRSCEAGVPAITILRFAIASTPGSITPRPRGIRLIVADRNGYNIMVSAYRKGCRGHSMKENIVAGLPSVRRPASAGQLFGLEASFSPPM